MVSLSTYRKDKIVFQMRYMFAGKQRRADIGTYPLLRLKDARDELLNIRRALEEGIDPQMVRQCHCYQMLLACCFIYRIWMCHFGFL